MTQDNDFIRDWMEGKISPEELENKRLRDNRVVNEHEKIISESSKLKVPAHLTQDQAWQKLVRKIEKQPRREINVVKIKLWIPMSIAASIAMFAVSYFLFFGATIVSTKLAEKLVFVLPDGSEVVLNADSKIAFTKASWKYRRSISLEGEAFFKVKKGSKFTVTSDAGTITVLGTSFNANVRQNAVEISCFSGSVKVSHKKEEVIIAKGEFTYIAGDTLAHAAKFDEIRKATWRYGEFYFDSKPLGVVIDELERQFNVMIEYRGDVSRMYSGYFNTKKLDDALLMVFKPMSLNYHKVNGKKIVIE